MVKGKHQADSTNGVARKGCLMSRACWIAPFSTADRMENNPVNSKKLLHESVGNLSQKEPTETEVWLEAGREITA